MGLIATDLTTDAAITYANKNGVYTFSPAANVLRVNIRPVMDQAKRTVTHSIYTFTIEDILQAADQTDALKVDSTAIRRILNYPGGGLTVQGVGIGNFAVNTAPFSVVFNPNNIAWDCLWGPLPVELSWENYGNGKAGKIVWQVSCAVAEQCADAASQTAIMAYNYDAVWTKDSAGYQRRMVNGYIEIPITRTDYVSTNSPDNVDRLRENCYPSITVGWKRTGDSWKVSMDRRRADFAYTDEEQPFNAPAEGVINCDETVSAESSQHVLGTQVVTLSGTYEMIKTKQRSESWYHFTRFCTDRIKAMTEAYVAQKKGLPANKLPATTTVIPIKLRVEESVHSRTSGKFSLVVQHTLAAETFEQAIANSVAGAGLWQPPTEGGQDWTKWNQSMTAGGVYTARGVANTKFENTAQTDTIIDLCLSQPASTLSPGPINVKLKGFGQAAIIIPAPPAESSFLDYKVGLLIEEFDTVAELKPLPTDPILYSGGDDSSSSTMLNTSSNWQGSSAGFLSAYKNSPTSILQDRTGSHTAVTIYGAALRAGYKITPPLITKIGGVAARRQNRGGNYFKQWLWGNLGIPIVAAVWSQRYILASQPKLYDVPPNLLYSLEFPNPIAF